MVSFKSLCMMIAIVMGFTACASSHKAYLPTIDTACQQGLQKAVAAMMDVPDVKLASHPFKNSALIYLSNIKPNPFGMPNPMMHTHSKEQAVMLHQTAKGCTVSLVNDKKEILKSTLVTSCKCERLKTK